MNVMVPIPEELAARFGSEAELGRRLVEALALEEYRGGRLTEFELRQLLGFATRYDLDGFLKARGIFHDYTLEDLAREQETLDRLGI